MGTRNLTGVRLLGATRVAQYGQWDGYPTGQGETVSVFLRTANLKKFKEEVDKLEWITDEEAKQYWVEAGADPNSDFVNMEVSSRFKNAHPELSRDTGAEILQMIHDGQVKKLRDSSEFLKDGLFCEWAYILDLDKEVVEVYSGGLTPIKVLTFADFAREGRMEKLEEELNGEEE